MRKKFRKYIILASVFLLVFSFDHTKCDEKQGKLFADVPSDCWYYTAVTELYNNNIIGGSENFYGESPASRGDIVLAIYNLDKCLGKNTGGGFKAEFSDVAENSEYFAPVAWAAENGITDGFEDLTFRPDAQCSKEQLCTFAMRYLALRDIKPAVVGICGQFADSLSVDGFARSYVLACRMSGIVNGDEKGYFRPNDAVTRAETASVVYALMNIGATGGAAQGSEFVNTSPGAYDGMYASFKTERQYFFNAYVPAGNAVDISYFNDVALVGDSVTMSLKYYCAASGALGNAQFICAGSLSPMNALWEVSENSKHPSYNGVKMKVEDAVAASGANKVYIMLGINSLANGVESTFNDMKTLVERICQKSPNVKIIIQSVTPLTADSPITTQAVNNGTVIQYNEKLLALCQEKGWYYINVAESMRDADGSLIKSYCSDPTVMGIHFTFAADKVWCDYLKTHVPDELR